MKRPISSGDLAAMHSYGPNGGRVYLVGAGPGDPGLITVRGTECLRRADLVLYDCSVNPAILDYVPQSAQLVCVDQQAKGRTMPPEEIRSRMIEAARQGKTAVRLKSGDEDVLGPGAEDTRALRAAGIPFETVPGVTAPLAAAGYAEIPLFHSNDWSAITIVRGQKGHSGRPTRPNYQALANLPGTLVFDMEDLPHSRWDEALIRHGKPPRTPAMIVHRCGWNDQATLRCTLATVATVIAERGLCPPGVIFVGETASRAPNVSWFAARPLFGVRVMVTRPRQQDDPLSNQLRQLGADVQIQPAIRISAPGDWEPVDKALRELDRYDWVVFSSANGVRYLLERLCEINGDLRKLGRAKLAAIGPGTADQLARYHLRADLVPDEHRAESLAAALAAEAPGRRFLLARASRGREVLAESLSAAGAKVEQIVAYSSTEVEQPDKEATEMLASGRVHWVTVTSSAIARSLVRLFGDDLQRSKLASISPITSKAIRQLGHEPAVEATRYTMGGLVDVLLAAVQRESSGKRSNKPVSRE